jgi:hypothetical protein
MGLTDPLLGMGGSLWDLWVRVSPALAGGQERTAYLHPGSDGGLRMCDVSAEERIASCRRAGRGISAQAHAMYPKMRPRLHRHPPQVQQGYEEARGHCSVGWGMVQAQVDCRCGGGGLQRGRLPLRWAQWRRQQLQQ